jgi:hypothetical protein
LPNILQNVFKKIYVFQKLNHPGMRPTAIDEIFIDSIDFSQGNPNQVRPLLDSEMAQISTAITD